MTRVTLNRRQLQKLLEGSVVTDAGPIEIALESGDYMQLVTSQLDELLGPPIDTAEGEGDIQEKFDE